MIMSSPNQILELPSVSRDSLHERIHRHLSEYMMVGRFAPGQKLPLRTIAKAMGTSLMPVRDALHQLQATGCLVSTAQGTMMVPIMTREQQAEIVFLRALLEGQAAVHAASNRSPADLKALEKHCAEIDKAAKHADLDGFLVANYQFHMAISNASKLLFIKDLLTPLWIRIGPVLREAKPNAEYITNAASSHRRIYIAVSDRDAGLAKSEIEYDIKRCADNLSAAC